LELAYLDLKREAFDIKDSLLNNNTAKSLTSNETISQKRKENDKQNDSQEKRKLSVNKINDENSIEKILDVITIESDDNNDNDNDLKVH